MNRKLLASCPVCGGETHVTELRCDSCATGISGHFEIPPRFGMLSDAQLEYVEEFLRCEGNFRELEKVLGLSYPTVKSRLSDIRQRLGLAAKGTPERKVRLEVAGMKKARTAKRAGKEDAGSRGAPGGMGRLDILRKLDRGEIDIDSAMDLLTTEEGE